MELYNLFISKYIFLFVIILMFILVYFYLNLNFHYNNQEKFIVCENIPSGPYLTYCSLVNFYNNKLTAYCNNKNNENKLVYSNLDLNTCVNNNKCSSININMDGKLVC